MQVRGFQKMNMNHGAILILEAAAEINLYLYAAGRFASVPVRRGNKST
jgi:hypothetical protein